MTNHYIDVHASTLYPPSTTFAECSNLAYDSYYSFFDQEVVIEYKGDGENPITWNDITASQTDITSCPCNVSAFISLKFVGAKTYSI